MSALLVECDGPVERWTLNRPEVRNALDERLVAELRSAVSQAEAAEADVVVLRGAGPSFCAGADLSMLATHDASLGQTPRRHLSEIWELTLEMERSPVVFVTVLHGHAIAGGLELALASDVVLAATGTLIGDGHVRHSLMPGGGASARMERSLGRATSTWLALTGAFVPAEDNLFGGWLHRVEAPNQLERAIETVVKDLVSVPADARRAYKQLLSDTHGALDTSDRDRELDAFDRHWLAHDVPGALRNFLSKNRKVS